MNTLVPVNFRFPGTLAPRAGEVAVVGSFNSWNPTVHLLTKISDGDWTITLYLPPGRAVYGFSVDGTFWLDPHDEGRICNGWGSEYSIRYIRPDTTPNRASLASDFGTEAIRKELRPA
jgi:hypothetical protein